MPANLTPQYRKAEEAYRKAHTPEEQIVCLGEMLKLIPKHKGTEKLQADLKSKLKEAKAEATSTKVSAKKGSSFRFPRQGAGRAVLVGGPNSGKSRMVKELTNADPQVADFPFTTREPLPSMMPWDDATVQLIDTPPMTASHVEPYLIDMVRSADLAILCLDGSSDDSPDDTHAVIEQLRNRKTVLGNYSGFDEDDFSVVHIKTLLVVTRGDNPDSDLRLDFLKELVPFDFGFLKVELDREESREELRREIFRALDVIRVYTKAPGKPADYKDPYTIPRGATVEDLALKVHRELAEKLKFAKVWGENVHDGQTVGRDHTLCDKDLVELHV